MELQGRVLLTPKKRPQNKTLLCQQLPPFRVNVRWQLQCAGCPVYYLTSGNSPCLTQNVDCKGEPTALCKSKRHNSQINLTSVSKDNKKLWEELMAYFFLMTRTAQKTTRPTVGGDLFSAELDMDTPTERQQNNLRRLLLFFQNKESGLKKEMNVKHHTILLTAIRLIRLSKIAHKYGGKLLNIKFEPNPANRSGSSTAHIHIQMAFNNHFPCPGGRG